MIGVDDIALAIGESIAANFLFEKYRNVKNQMTLKRLAKDIDEKCLKVFIHKYQDELFYHKLDSYMVSESFVENLIHMMNDFHRDDSIESYIESTAEDFIQQNKEFIVYKNRIIGAISFIKNEIESIFSQNGVNSINFALMKIYDKENNALEKLDLIIKILNSNTYLDTIQPSIVDTERYKTTDSKEKAFNIITTLIENKAYKDAVVKIEEYVNIYPEEFTRYNLAGAILMDINDMERAKEEFEKVLNKDSQNIEALYNMAVLEYDKVTKENKYDVRPTINKAEVMSYQLNKAIEYIDKAYKVDNESIEVMNFKAYLYMITKKDLSLAEKLFIKCKKQSKKVSYTINLTICYLLKKEYSSALKLAQELCYYDLENIEQAAFIFGLVGNIYATPGIRNIAAAVKLLEFTYLLSKDKNYLVLSDNIRKGNVIDSIYLNGMVVNILDAQEFMEEVFSGDPSKYIVEGIND